ncbi:Arc family DNA-binding protein [Pseudogemmobacter sonorensis]|uniref:Arc family DNA-binding protein n=1 Tax=Pseudogemmobacter sonorensis TaxID=2989681 RepID=UPI0036CFCAFC
MDANDDTKRTTLRLPQYLYDRIEAAAAKNNRSLNAEIIHTLEYEYQPEPDEAVQLLEDEIARLKTDPDTNHNMIQILGAAKEIWARRARLAERRKRKLELGAGGEKGHD